MVWLFHADCKDCQATDGWRALLPLSISLPLYGQTADTSKLKGGSPASACGLGSVTRVKLKACNPCNRTCDSAWCACSANSCWLSSASPCKDSATCSSTSRYACSRCCSICTVCSALLSSLCPARFCILLCTSQPPSAPQPTPRASAVKASPKRRVFNDERRTERDMQKPEGS